jgi:HEAT repeat protein
MPASRARVKSVSVSILAAALGLLAAQYLAGRGRAEDAAQRSLSVGDIPPNAAPEVVEQITRMFSSDGLERGKAAVAMRDMIVKAAPAIPFLESLLPDDARLQWLLDRQTTPGEESAITLGRMGKQGYDVLAAAISSQNAATRASAALGLGETGPAALGGAVGSLVIALKDPVQKVRRNAAISLGNLEDSRATPALIESLRDGASLVRGAAALALGQIRSPADSIIAALRPLLQDKDWYTRDSALRSLGEIPSFVEVETIAALLKDEDDVIRGDAAWSLGRIGSPLAVDPLLVALRDKDSYVRSKAAEALGKIGDKRAIEPLSEVLNDPAPAVNIEAQKALDRLRGKKP